MKLERIVREQGKEIKVLINTEGENEKMKQ